MDVSGQRQQLFLLDHDDGFLPGGFGCFLQVELFLHRDHKHVVLSALSLGYQSLEHLIRILTHEPGYILHSYPWSEHSLILEAFTRHEQDKAKVPLQKGPFANFLMTLSNIQALFPDRENAPIRTALVTSRNARALERPLLTLRNWGVRVDEAFFLGGVSKKEVLASFGAHIFFDDQHAHTDPASEVVPSAVVPYRAGDDPAE